MDLKEFLPFLIPLSIFLGAGGFGYWLARSGGWAVLGLCVAALLAISGYQWWQAQSVNSGWGGIAIAILVLLFLLPAALGLSVGALFQVFRARRR